VAPAGRAAGSLRARGRRGRAIALAILAVATIEWWFSYVPFPLPHKGLGLVPLVVGAIGLTIRRQNLLIAFVLVEALPVIGLIANAPVLLGNGAFLMDLILLYSAAERCGPFLAALALAAQPIVDLLAFQVPFHTGSLSLAEGDSAVIVMAWFAGRAQARRRGVAARLEETVEHVRDERERLARAAVAVERSRIATELHGLVIRGVERMNARTLIAFDSGDGAGPRVQRGPSTGAGMIHLPRVGERGSLRFIRWMERDTPQG
jgi:signal transduction histidine kinase